MGGCHRARRGSVLTLCRAGSFNFVRSSAVRSSTPCRVPAPVSLPPLTFSAVLFSRGPKSRASFSAAQSVILLVVDIRTHVPWYQVAGARVNEAGFKKIPPSPFGACNGKKCIRCHFGNLSVSGSSAPLRGSVSPFPSSWLFFRVMLICSRAAMCVPAFFYRSLFSLIILVASSRMKHQQVVRVSGTICCAEYQLQVCDVCVCVSSCAPSDWVSGILMCLRLVGVVVSSSATEGGY